MLIVLLIISFGKTDHGVSANTDSSPEIQRDPIVAPVTAPPSKTVTSVPASVANDGESVKEIPKEVDIADKQTVSHEKQSDDEKRASDNILKPSYPMGQVFSVGYFSYVVNHVEAKADSWNRPILAIDITVRNDDDTDSMTPMLRLLDESGKDVGGAFLELATPSGDLRTKLKSGVPYRGYVAFEKVPVDEKYILLVSGGLMSGKSAIVPLSSPEHH